MNLFTLNTPLFLSRSLSSMAKVKLQYLQPTKTSKIIKNLLMGLILTTLATQLNAASNESLGRLFSKPTERNNLDYLRQNQKLKVISPQDTPQPEPTAEAPPLELPNPITLQGYVKRGDGTKSTLWINNKPVQEGSMVDNVQIGLLNKRGFSAKGASTEGVDVKIPVNGRNVRLKAGQMYEPETDKIKELQVVEKAKRLRLEEAGVIDDGNVE